MAGQNRCLSSSKARQHPGKMCSMERDATVKRNMAWQCVQHDTGYHNMAWRGLAWRSNTGMGQYSRHLLVWLRKLIPFGTNYKRDALGYQKRGWFLSLRLVVNLLHT